jgi:hypothetical protein
VPLSRPFLAIRPAMVLVALALLFVPVAASARPYRAPGPPGTARDRPSSDAPFVTPGRAEAARAVGRYYASFGSEPVLAPPVSAVAPPRPIEIVTRAAGPSWAVALLVAIAAAALGAVAGYRTRVAPLLRWRARA